MNNQANFKAILWLGLLLAVLLLLFFTSCGEDPRPTDVHIQIGEETVFISYNEASLAGYTVELVIQTQDFYGSSLATYAVLASGETFDLKANESIHEIRIKKNE